MNGTQSEEPIHLYTDGACSPNPGPSGAGVLMRYKGHERKISKFLGHGTNNTAELTAIKVALQEVKEANRNIPSIIYTDSQYSIGVLSNLTWKPKKNIALINELKAIMASFAKITFVKVRGHSDHAENNIVDKLAVDACRNRTDSSVRSVSKK